MVYEIVVNSMSQYVSWRSVSPEQKLSVKDDIRSKIISDMATKYEIILPWAVVLEPKTWIKRQVVVCIYDAIREVMNELNVTRPYIVQKFDDGGSHCRVTFIENYKATNK